MKHKQLQGFGNKTIIDGKVTTIGAGGRYGGVHLATSDSLTQEQNRAMLEAMFERERRRWDNYETKSQKEQKLEEKAALAEDQ